LIDIWLDRFALPALLIGFAVGLLAGLLFVYSFRRFTPAEKRHWEENRLMHHYSWGLVALLVGIFSPLIAGMGIGLILTDIGDLKERLSKKSREVFR
jgi:H+/Cl- antiporter ClcA